MKKAVMKTIIFGCICLEIISSIAIVLFPWTLLIFDYRVPFSYVTWLIVIFSVVIICSKISFEIIKWMKKKGKISESIYKKLINFNFVEGVLMIIPMIIWGIKTI